MSELCIRMVMNFTLSSFYAPGWRLNIDSLGWLSYFAQRIQGFTETFTYSCRIMSKFCICIHGFFNNLPQHVAVDSQISYFPLPMCLCRCLNHIVFISFSSSCLTSHVSSPFSDVRVLTQVLHQLHGNWGSCASLNVKISSEKCGLGDFVLQISQSVLTQSFQVTR